MNWTSVSIVASATCTSQKQYSLRRLTKSKPVGFIGAAMTAGVLIAPTACFAADWPSAGADLTNSRYQDTENSIKANSVGSLQKKWEFTTSGDVQAHPAVDGGYLYFPDSAGFLYKVNKLLC